MAVRLITSAVGLVVFFAAFFANDLIFSLAVAAVSVIMVYEMVNVVKPGNEITAVSVVFAVLMFAAEIAVPSLRESGLLICLICMIFVYLILSVIKFNKTDFHKIYSSMFATLYITLFMSFIILLRDIGRYAVIPVFLFSWVTDSGAYFAGRFFGKHKLAPELSPKKTVEGAIGGIAATVIGTVIYIVILKYCFNIEISNNLLFIIAAAVGAVLSEVGDLVASVVKRMCVVKDFGWIFPGHGGMLDRFDSVVFIAPYVYLIFILMQICG